MDESFIIFSTEPAFRVSSILDCLTVIGFYCEALVLSFNTNNNIIIVVVLCGGGCGGGGSGFVVVVALAGSLPTKW